MLVNSGWLSISKFREISAAITSDQPLGKAWDAALVFPESVFRAKPLWRILGFGGPWCGSTKNMGTPTILLAEDDANDVLLLKRAFERAGITNPLHVTSDGEEALAYLAGRGRFADREQNPVPALLLLDLKMPKLSGFEVLQWVRQHSTLKRLPIVVLSSSFQYTDINRAYDLGANSYLVKPADFNTRIDLVKKLQAYWLTANQMAEYV